MKIRNWKSRLWTLSLLTLLLSVGIIGCGAPKEEKDQTANEAEKEAESNLQEAPSQEEAGETEEVKEDIPMRAVYLKNSSGAEIFVELENETPFFGTLPEEIVEEDGTVVVQEDMKSGDVYEIYGNQIMLRSYPGQYPGIHKMVRIEKENQTYVEEYKEYLEQFCPEPDTTQPPELSVEYRQPTAVVTAAVNKGGYEWKKGEDEESTEVEIADAPQVLVWDDEMLEVMRLEEAAEFLLHFSYEPQTVKVLRWPAIEREKAQNEEQYAQGETVRVEQKENGFAFEGEPGYIYEIVGEWVEGTVQYGFLTA